MSLEIQLRFDTAVQAAVDGATVVTATTRASRAVMAEAIRRRRGGNGTCRTPDILPLDAFYQRLWGDAIVAGAATKALLSHHRVHALWRRAILQSKHAGDLLAAQGSARMAQDAWRTAHAYQITIEPRTFRGLPEPAAFCEWSSIYKEELARGEWIDAASLPPELAGLFSQIAESLPTALVVYGFGSLSPRDSEFCRALEARGTRVQIISSQVSEAAAGCSMLPADSTDDELRLAATWARKKLMADVTQRIGVVVPRLPDLRDRVEATFAAVLHPEEFLSAAPNANRAFEIAAGRPLHEYSLVRHALMLLRFAMSEVPIADASSLLCSPFIGDPEESAARALYDVQLRKYGRRAHCSAETLPVQLERGARVYKAPPRFSHLLRRLRDLSPPSTKLLAPSEAANLFNTALEAAKWPSRELDSTEYQLWEKWDGLLADFASLDGFLPAQNAPALVDELSRMAASVSFRPENSGAPVQIMDEEESAGCAFDGLWVCGMTDEWPRVPRPNPYLPLALQRAAGVPNLTPAERHASAVGLVARLSAAAAGVILSWPKCDRERDFRPHRLLLGLSVADPATVCGPVAPSCLSIERSAAKMEFIDDEQAPPVDPETLPHRSTDVLKYQSHCPFRAFAQFRLGAQELESPELGLDRRLRGGLVETALEIFWGHMRDSVNLRDLTPSARLNEVLDDSVEKALGECWPESQTVWDQRLRAIEKRRLRNLLRQWCDVELRRRDEFDVMIDEQQQEIDIELGGLKIHGRIDRVDRLRRGGFVVIDYKSGMKPKPANWVSERPEEPQLPLYAVYQLDQGREVKGVAFGHVTTADAAWLGYGDPLSVVGITRDTFKQHLNGKTWPQFVAGWKVTLENLATSFVAGDAEVGPKRRFGNNSTCRYCHLHSLCRVAEMPVVSGEEDGGGDDE